MSYTHDQEVKEQDLQNLTAEQVIEALYPGLGEPVTDPDAPFFNED